MATKEGYHHGDLRHASIDAGLAMLRERRTDDLGLREVARAVGVSPTALYRHFPDKAAFFAALAAAGFERLAEAQAAAQHAAGPGSAGFGASGRAYIDFALANPALFRLMFSHAPHLDVPEAAPPGSAMGLLRSNVEALLGPGHDPAAVTAMCVHAWALVHGLSVLLLDRQLPPDDALIAAALDPLATLGPTS